MNIAWRHPGRPPSDKSPLPTCASLHDLEGAVVRSNLERRLRCRRQGAPAPGAGARTSPDAEEGQQEAQAAGSKSQRRPSGRVGLEALLPPLKGLELGYDVAGQGLWRFCGLVGQREVAAAVPPALAALGGAEAPVLPVGPGAEGLGAAPPRATADLLVGGRFAILATLRRVLGDVAEALALAVALGASAPVLPITVLAVLGIAQARVPPALRDLDERPVAGFATVRRVAHHLACAECPAAPAAGRALTPLGPAAQQAIDRRHLHATLGRLATGAGVARRGLLQAADAELAVPATVSGDASRPPLDAAAGAGAVAPGAPVRERAINGRLTADVGVAELHLPVFAGRWGAALSGHLRDLARPERDASAAGL
mmetsp:Transcript_100453/g.279729  ORF Transcript_100453/g.279729 Transcript_100453/m.279729 type:complete len:370 (+) Transcript_100453:351-1460(+)